MQTNFMLVFLNLAFFTLFISDKSVSSYKDQMKKGGEIYSCLPCGSDCDAVEYKTGGTCSQCSMELVKKSTIKHGNVEPGDLCDFIAKTGSDNVLLLDVRTTAEFEGQAREKFGRLKNAVNIPIQVLETRLKKLAVYKDKEIVVYCSHSHRSPRASYLLSQKGFKNVTNMQGGMSVWADSVKDAECNRKLFIRQ